MPLLIGGLVLWTLAHYFKRLMPDRRAAMGNAGKGAVAVAIVASLVMMIYGYRWAAFIPVWQPPAFMVHVNNLLMVVSIFIFGMSATTGRLRGKLRHPQLLALKIWAAAHLLVNGDLASIVLFGGLLLWAGGSVALINRAEDWARPEPGEAKKDILLVAITIGMFAVITAIHVWLGVWPFPG